MVPSLRLNVFGRRLYLNNCEFHAPQARIQGFRTISAIYKVAIFSPFKVDHDYPQIHSNSRPSDPWIDLSMPSSVLCQYVCTCSIPKHRIVMLYSFTFYCEFLYQSYRKILCTLHCYYYFIIRLLKVIVCIINTMLVMLFLFRVHYLKLFRC